MRNLVVLNNFPHIKKQIAALLKPHAITVFEASTSDELYVILASNTIDLLLVDFMLHERDYHEILAELRDKNIHVPFMILTTSDKRDAFIKAMQAGALDYILIPFEDIQFVNRIKHHFSTAGATENIVKPKLTPDFKKYLSGELAKAHKGNYTLSISIFTIFNKVSKSSEASDPVINSLADKFYKETSALLWDTDFIVRYGSQSFIGVFPFSDQKNNDKIKN